MDQIGASTVNGPDPARDCGRAARPRPALARVAGHFGELAQGRLGPGGPVALVTLPCPALVTEVRYRPAPGALVADVGEAAKLSAAAALVLARVAPPGWGGRLEVRRAAPPGGGAGQSTADVLGTVRAVAAAFGRRFAAEEEARLCLAAEGAVDPLMHGGPGAPVLFASREARVVRSLAPLPRLRVVGGFAGPGAATEPGDDDFPPMERVFERLVAALAAGDARALAQAARASAEANQARNPNPVWGAVLAAGRRAGALGPVVAHTGSAIGLLLPADAPAEPLRAELAALGLAQVVAFKPMRRGFRVAAGLC